MSAAISILHTPRRTEEKITQDNLIFLRSMCARNSKKKITQRMFSMPEINHPKVVQDERVNTKINELITRFG
jgi:hypothetical protein